MYQLPGSVRSTQQRTPAGLALATLVIALVLSFSAAWIAREFLGTSPSTMASPVDKPLEDPPPPLEDSVTASDDHDLAQPHLLVHLLHLQEKHKKMSVSTRKAQDLIRLVAASLDREFMQMQRRRLESSDFHMESVRRETEESLEEIEMIISQLRRTE